MSGGVQTWMSALSDRFDGVALLNAYLPGELPFELTDRLMHRNAHPPCTDFYAARRMASLPTWWLAKCGDLVPIWRAVRAVVRMRSARLLMIGETEPWTRYAREGYL